MQEFAIAAVDEYNYRKDGLGVTVRIPSIGNLHCHIDIDSDDSVVVDSLTVNGNGRACKVRDAKHADKSCTIG